MVSAEAGVLFRVMTACEGLESITVQVAVPPVASIVGVHWKFVIQGALVNCNIVDFAVPFQDTVIRAVSSFSTALM